MSKKNQNVFERFAEALKGISDELDTLNSYLYGIGAELADLNSKVESLEKLIEQSLKNPLRVTVNTESLVTTVKKAEETVKPTKSAIPKAEFTSS